MSDILVDWSGATWQIGEHRNGEYHCTVVQAKSTSGWHVGERCWLTTQELHPTNGKDTS